MRLFSKIRRATNSMTNPLGRSFVGADRHVPLNEVEYSEHESLRRACCLDLVSSSGCMTENGAHALMSYFSREF